MTQAYNQPSAGLSDQEMRDSIRVMQRERNTKLALVIAATIVGIVVLLVTAYLGLV